jgi:hypothetical protein
MIPRLQAPSERSIIAEAPSEEGPAILEVAEWALEGWWSFAGGMVAA